MEIRGVEYYCMDCDKRYIEHFTTEPVIWHCKKCNREGVLIESRNSQQSQGQGNSFQNGNNSPFADPNPFDLPADGLPF